MVSASGTSTPHYASLAQAFAELGERIREVTPERTPEAIAEVAVAQVPGAAWASVTVLRGQRFQTIAATDTRARQADHLQYQLGSGPCVDAILDDNVYHPDNLQHDIRWPEFGRRVSEELGVNSMLSYRLSVDDEEVIAGLNLYGRGQHAFDDDALNLGVLLAAHASLAVSAAVNKQRADNLQQALESNRDIGVALGVLMTQHKLTRQQAFDLLRVASQQSNRKLHDLALEVADTGTLDLPRNRRSHRRNGGDRGDPRGASGTTGQHLA